MLIQLVRISLLLSTLVCAWFLYSNVRTMRRYELANDWHYIAALHSSMVFILFLVMSVTALVISFIYNPWKRGSVEGQ